MSPFNGTTAKRSGLVHLIWVIIKKYLECKYCIRSRITHFYCTFHFIFFYFFEKYL